MKSNLVFLDVETDGLYGGFLSAPLIATDMQGNEIERAYYGIEKSKLNITEPWVIEHVLPYMGEYEACENEEELLHKAWTFWMKYQETAYAVAYVGYPVECRFLEACVRMNVSEHAFQAPFPLLDLSSILLAKGYDPLLNLEELVTEDVAGNKHNPLYDVEMAVMAWKHLMKTE